MLLCCTITRMVLVGRLLIGLGGARGVNRRYIADTVPVHTRTFFSAAFVAVGAVGMAFGPFSKY
jgi:MFS family permease